MPIAERAGCSSRSSPTEGVERLPGAHCYEVFAGSAAFAAMADSEPGTFWLTDFLARNFERLVIRGLGIDRHPELQAIYFANYTRVVYLSQVDDPDLLAMARRAADRLGLAFEHRPTGMAGLAAPLERWVAKPGRAATRDSRGTGEVDVSRRPAFETAGRTSTSTARSAAASLRAGQIGATRRRDVATARRAGRSDAVHAADGAPARGAGTPDERAGRH